MDRDEFSRLLPSIIPQLLKEAFILCSGNRDDAEDLMQETLSIAYESISTFRQESSLPTWLTAIARRQSSKLRYSYVQSIDVETVGSQLTSPDSPDSELDMKERYRMLHCAINKLSPAERKAVRLHYFEGKKSREVGAIMGINTNTVTSLFSNARKKLEKILGNEKI